MRRARIGQLSAMPHNNCFRGPILTSLVGLACYLIFYRLDPIPAYWIGMVPLAVDGVVAAILAAIVTLTRVP